MVNDIQTALFRLRDEFMSRLPGRLSTLRDLLDAVARNESGSLDAFLLAVHNLVGAAGTYGLQKLSVSARELELIAAAIPKNKVLNDADLHALHESMFVMAAQAEDSAFHLVPQMGRLNIAARVAVVDDDAEQAAWMRTVLEESGYDVELFSELGAFRASLDEQNPPAAVIMDMMFPEGDDAGAQFVAEIKERSLARIPVIFCSVRKDMAARLAAHRAGASHYLTKPVERDVLLHVISDSVALKPDEPYRVLVVDDSSSQLAFHAHILQRADMTVLAVTDPMQVLDVLSDFAAEVVLLDMYMPQCSGSELAAILRDDGRYAGIPVVYLSTEASVTEQLLALDRGGDHFLVKPVQPTHLVSVMQMHARRYRLSTEHARALRYAHYAQERQRQAVDEHAIVSEADASGNIIFVNEKFCEISGYARNELIGKNHRIVKSNVHPAGFYEEMWRAISGGKVWEGEICNRAKSGEYYWVRSTIVPYLDENGRPYQYVSIRTDITHLKSTEKALSDAKIAAESANRAKGDFLANMSHEIRTPMNAIIGFSQLCLQTSLEPVQREYIAKVYQSANSLLGIINDILDFSRIESGKLSIENIPFRLDELLSSVAAQTCVRAEEKGLEFLIHKGMEIPRTLIGDSLRLGQILSNLISNAVKFTRDGEVSVQINVISQCEQRETLRFTVTDTGVGLTKEQLGRLFQSFSQADTSTTRKYGGTGLGLAICKHLVELMGGRIWVESTPGKGSRFSFEIPFGTFADQSQHAFFDPSLFKVLVVDDNDSARALMLAYLESFGMKASAVADCAEAEVAICQADTLQQPFSDVLLDWSFQGASAFDLAQRIKQELPLVHRPMIVYLASHSQNSTFHKMADEKLIDAMLSKPVVASGLYDALMNAHSNQLEQTSHVVAAPVYNLAGLHILLVEDNEVNQQLASALLKRAGVAVSIAGDGREALPMLRQRRFDAVLMDIQMPVMDGFEATRQIREIPAFAELPVIAMTANAMSGDRERCIDAGMNDYIAKPIHQQTMYSVIARWTRRDTAVQVKAEQPEAIKVGAVLDTVTAISCMGGADIYLGVLEKFIPNQGCVVHAIQKAFVAGDIGTTKRLAHTLKGVAATIGAARLSEMAHQLEQAIGAEKSDQYVMLLKTAAVEMDKVIAAATAYVDVQTGASEPDVSTHDKDELARLLKQMAGQLQIFDGSASDTMHQIMQRVRGHATELHFARLLNYINAYDYESALTEVQRIAPELDIGN
jgi:PAS domain S-box-containing protein